MPPGTPYRITDFELASRLSFFFWSSMPDEELLRAARDGPLEQPDVLAQQVHADARRRALDRRSSAISPGSGCTCATCSGNVPNSDLFPDFDDNLRQAFQREAELFFESIIREDRSVLDLMTADYTFVNERLARHYGIPDVFGSHFRRVPLADDARRGMLGKGAVLLVTSHADTTSPVLRGKWVLENLLGAPPPPPPADLAGAQDRSAGLGAEDDARADGAAPHEPGLRDLPPADGSDRLRAGELRRWSAPGGRKDAAACRSTPPTC